MEKLEEGIYEIIENIEYKIEKLEKILLTHKKGKTKDLLHLLIENLENERCLLEDRVEILLTL
jgi:hypothetical protein